MTHWIDNLITPLAKREEENLYRYRNTVDSPQGAVISIAGRDYINFSSNDYLGLANHPDVVSRFQTAIKDYGAGAGASHLVVGHQLPHHNLEKALAEFTGRDRALVFSSGYMANLGILSGLLSKGDAVIQDKLNHASLIDGARLSSANFLRFRHNDLEHLEVQLEKTTECPRKILAVDGVFSMDGDMSPLKDLSSICKKYDAALMVDDAHGFGWLGENGAGISEHFDLDQDDLPILMGTLGKAIGVAGAFVAGSNALIESLIQLSRSYIYTTALPPACAEAILQSLKVNKDEPQRRAHLKTLIDYFKEKTANLNFQFLPSSSAIQALVVGDNSRALALSERLMEEGMMISAIRPPTVPAESARLRITLSAAHTFSQLDQLIQVLEDCQP
ncbi:MAG: 8-amino-7-oxononanoate synthase [Cellvibrionales bacterium]|nr:8-amino-7-oxononanoate synthase [Cellvibrionales bacterium]|tara:strand:+ start:8091 stop:9257 length:1167 start_codon:yes stop_codon:yes gene_type:complete